MVLRRPLTAGQRTSVPSSHPFPTRRPQGCQAVPGPYPIQYLSPLRVHIPIHIPICVQPLEVVGGELATAFRVSVRFGARARSRETVSIGVEVKIVRRGSGSGSGQRSVLRVLPLLPFHFILLYEEANYNSRKSSQKPNAHQKMGSRPLLIWDG